MQPGESSNERVEQEKGKLILGTVYDHDPWNLSYVGKEVRRVMEIKGRRGGKGLNEAKTDVMGKSEFSKINQSDHITPLLETASVVQ